MADLSDMIEVQMTASAVGALRVYQVQPAPPAIAGWLQRHFAPVIKACRFERPAPPIELRPTGEWGGWAWNGTTAPDGRVAISNRIVLYSQAGITRIVVHEWAHQLAQGHAHDAAFFAVNLLLLKRIEAASSARTTATDLTLKMSFYDLQDLPEGLEGESDAGLGAALSWAVLQADELAQADLSAEAAAQEISERYEAWLAQLEAAPAKQEAAAKKQRQLVLAHKSAQCELAALRAKLRERTWWLAGTGATTILMAFGILKLAIH